METPHEKAEDPTPGAAAAATPSLLGAREQLIHNIKEWMTLTNEINQMKHLTKQKNDRKKQLNQNIMHVMKTHNLDYLDITGGHLVYNVSKQKKTLSGKNLLEILNTYFKSDEALSKELAEFIMSNREVRTSENLKLKLDKKRS